jgi:hypothetical protein
MILSRPVAPRASRTADIVASVPEETKRTFRIDGTAATTASAISLSRSVGAPKLVPSSRARVTSARTVGWPWPRIIGPQEPM